MFSSQDALYLVSENGRFAMLCFVAFTRLNLPETRLRRGRDKQTSSNKPRFNSLTRCLSTAFQPCTGTSRCLGVMQNRFVAISYPQHAGQHACLPSLPARNGTTTHLRHQTPTGPHQPDEAMFGTTVLEPCSGLDRAMYIPTSIDRRGGACHGLSLLPGLGGLGFLLSERDT